MVVVKGLIFYQGCWYNFSKCDFVNEVYKWSVAILFSTLERKRCSNVMTLVMNWHSSKKEIPCLKNCIIFRYPGEYSGVKGFVGIHNQFDNLYAKDSSQLPVEFNQCPKIWWHPHFQNESPCMDNRWAHINVKLHFQKHSFTREEFIFWRSVKWKLVLWPHLAELARWSLCQGDLVLKNQLVTWQAFTILFRMAIAKTNCTGSLKV